MKLCKKIKIEVSEQDAATLEWMQGKCRSLYNWWVGKLRDGERWPGASAAKKTLAQSRVYDPELNGVYNKLLQEVFFRMDGAMTGFFRRVAEGQSPGFPRVRPRHRFFTLIYPAMYLEIKGNTLVLPTGRGGKWGSKRFPDVVVRLTEVPPNGFGDVAVTRDAQGNYFCSFVYDDTRPQPGTSWKRKKQKHKRSPATRRKHGIAAFDLGIKTLATGYTDEGRVYHIGGFKGYRYYNRQLVSVATVRLHSRCIHCDSLLRVMSRWRPKTRRAEVRSWPSSRALASIPRARG